MVIWCILVIILLVIILFLSLALFFFSKKSTYISNKEKEYLSFVISIFIDYCDDLGIQSKEQHKKLCEELEKIKNKHLKK